VCDPDDPDETTSVVKAGYQVKKGSRSPPRASQTVPLNVWLEGDAPDSHIVQPGEELWEFEGRAIPVRRGWHMTCKTTRDKLIGVSISEALMPESRLL